jgi:hypothetical protein
MKTCKSTLKKELAKKQEIMRSNKTKIRKVFVAIVSRFNISITPLLILRFKVCTIHLIDFTEFAQNL